MDELDKSLDKIETMSSKEDIADFIGVLRRSLEDPPERWSQLTLTGYLDALEASINGLDQGAINLGTEKVEEPSWSIFAEILNTGPIHD